MNGINSNEIIAEITREVMAVKETSTITSDQVQLWAKRMRHKG